MKRYSSSPLSSSISRLAIPLLVLCAGLSGCKKDDAEGPTGMGGESGTGDGDGDGDAPAPAPAACDRDVQCDDNQFCNGKETCKNGFCAVGKPIDCDDGIACTVDACDERENRCESTPPDEDGDGHTDANCADQDGVPLGDDCDDEDALSFPGNAEVCDPNNRDEDCDPTTLGVRDSDNDGYVDALCCNEQRDGSLECGDDCDDFRTNVNPRATEVCDFFDNDCDGEIDEDVGVERYPDTDHDGHGDDSAKRVITCPSAVGYSDDNIDCDDSDPEVFLGQFEICDGKDNNCDEDRLVDEVQQQAPWYPDKDGDTYGDPNSTPVFSCYRVPGRVLSQNDCNDEVAKVNPNATEICDALDNDCNGLADFRLSGVNNFEDDDRDGVADAECGGPDCDDRDARTSEGADEVCDYVDNDCDGEVDEQTTQNIWYIDEDGDGWGVVLGNALASCEPVVGRATEYGDCDDENPENHPGVVELCDGVDNDCDGQVDEGASAFCARDNALTTCKHGGCQIFACVPGFQDTDSDPQNGCEATAVPGVGIPCDYDSDCSPDGNICNGVEFCDGTCQVSAPINCSSGPSTVEGDVTISSGLDIQKLDGVSLITGDLTIQYTGLSTLIGLEDLEVIGGDLVIQFNDYLKKLSGSALSNLEIVGGDIIVEQNGALSSVDLPSLLSAQSLQILDNDSLENISGYQNLVTVGDLIRISENGNLKAIAGFGSLQDVGGSYLTNCYGGEGYASCEACGGGGLVVEYNPMLGEVTAFEVLQRVDGDVCFEQNGALGVHLPGLVDIGMSFVARDYEGKLTFAEFPELRDVGLEFGVYANSEGYGATQYVTAPVLKNVGEQVHVEVDGPTMKTVSMPKLRRTAKELVVRIYGAAEDLDLLDFSAFRSTTLLSIDYAANSGALHEVSFPSLQTVGEMYLYISSPSVQTISFDSFSSSDGSIDIRGAFPGLQTLLFPALESTENLTIVSSNASSLTALDLSSLSAVTGGLTLDLVAPLLSKLEFLELETASIDLTIESDGLSKVDFPLLTNLGSLSMSGEAPNVLEFNMPMVSTSSSSIEVTAGIDDVDFASLVSVGDSNSADFRLCIDDAAEACAIVTELVQNGYVGIYNVCDPNCVPPPG